MFVSHILDHSVENIFAKGKLGFKGKGGKNNSIKVKGARNVLQCDLLID